MTNSVVQVFQYKGSPITFNKGDNVMINATEMAKPFDKRPNDYLSLTSTKELIAAITKKNGICENQLVTTTPGSPANGGGTWLHEDIAIDFAQWLSIDFKLWCNDRIKELMRVGITATAPTLEALLANPDLVIGMATQLKQLRAENEAKQQKIEADAPKVMFAEAVETSDSVCLVGELAKILKQNGVVDMGQSRLYRWLRSHCYLGNKGDNYNLPTQKAMDLGIFRVIKGKRIDKHTGGVIVTRTAKVTTKGLRYFIDKFMRKA